MMEDFELKPGERLDDLQAGNLRIIQSDDMFSFSLDAVLLAHFAHVRSRDRVIDLGTGSGVIPLLLTAICKKGPREIVALEIQEHIAERAGRSVAGNGLSDTIRVVHGDLRQAARMFGTGTFDVVTCNPPYRPAGIGDASVMESIRIAKHEITCTLQDVVEQSAKLVKSGGKVALVHRPDRLVDIFYEMRRNKLEPKRMRLIHPREHTNPHIVLIEAIKDGGKELRIEPPLFVHEADGSYTEEIRKMYGGEILRL
ncbi:methyltransferase [Collibacillus ludicampi]|jgi:tRNA1(Val) A37 N6-methylase TrmN6|uniref:Methyltransferase n=1 Tax=Collibacillus ludicampi TaxID=2771369 RepID=A0AAV4LE77_9BACL|nr:tRNA1(Val) (adenine(37)-N6)-methyltransferase [Collibacillus ludicampi]GIM46016.1 methyltransferase [Collibacillus ludicampi]